MPSDVKMPQLGMNQDSAVIVAWLKAEGDKIASGDAIFEVETDKATVEVEAAADGYLAGIRAAEGADVPVGDVIAVIVETEAEVAEQATSVPVEEPVSEEPEEEPAPEALPAATPAPKVTPAPDQPDPRPPVPPVASPASGGKVLASPKAKRLASEGGIDLAALRAQGIAEPIHADDLARFFGRAFCTFGPRRRHGLRCALDRSPDADRTVLFSAFAAGAWRAVFEATEVAVAVRDLDGTTKVLSNPDRGGTGAADVAALSLVDLCDSRLSGYVPAGGGVALAVARDGEAYALSLSFSESSLPMAVAVALLDTIAARVEDPIRQLL